MNNPAIHRTIAAALVAMACSTPALALDNDTVDAAIGGGLGGAAGAAVGNEIGGRNGAIIGGAVGAAGGAAVTTNDDHDDHRRYRDHDRDYYGRDYGHGNFCPPGQAKKGRC
ncbi:glycine zipper domain-containing protein [Salinisphaera aquimarina]|uniref:Glycine zipper domain-containing protein n=1 Tax=Salinisphaera aquimarina TaxID=2094031 RepID=A0ABV7EVZ4_9GAMM